MKPRRTKGTCGECPYFEAWTHPPANWHAGDGRCKSIPSQPTKVHERDLECEARTAHRKAEVLLQQEQETIRAMEDTAVKHGYDKETGECLVDWLDKQLVDLRRLTEGIFGIHDVDETLREVKRICKDRQQLQDEAFHWKKKYDEKIFHNE